jgi:hypothetical protein
LKARKSKIKSLIETNERREYMPRYTSAAPDVNNSVKYMGEGMRTIWKSGGSLAWRNNNPGNVLKSGFAIRHGAIGFAHGKAIFPDDKTGRAAFIALLKKPKYQVGSLRDAITTYAPPEENNTAAYIKDVSTRTGIDPDTPMKSLTPSQKESLYNAIVIHERTRIGMVSSKPPVTASDASKPSGSESNGNNQNNDNQDNGEQDNNDGNDSNDNSQPGHSGALDPLTPDTIQKAVEWYKARYGDLPGSAGGNSGSADNGGDVYVQAYTRSAPAGNTVNVESYYRSHPAEAQSLADA